MANAGNGIDTKLFKFLIKTEQLIKIYPTDDPYAVLIKTKINNVVANDVAENEVGYSGNKSYKYVSHTAWGNMYQTLIKINQIRQKNWYFNTLKL